MIPLVLFCHQKSLCTLLKIERCAFPRVATCIQIADEMQNCSGRIMMRRRRGPNKRRPCCRRDASVGKYRSVELSQAEFARRQCQRQLHVSDEAACPGGIQCKRSTFECQDRFVVVEHSDKIVPCCFII